NVTLLFATIGSNPKPAMLIVVVPESRLAVLLVTTGVTLATRTGAPLLTPFVVTTAFRFPAVLGIVENVTVSDVALAAVTDPTAPSSNVTVLFAAAGSKPTPWIETVVALAGNPVELLVTPGVTAATCTAEPLLAPFVVTTAFNAPAAVGFVENVMVS